MASESTYWAAKEGEALGNACVAKVEKAQKHMRATGLWGVWVRAHNAYFGMSREGYNSHALDRRGNKGQYTAFIVNHFRNLLTHYRILASGQRPTLEPMAATGESRAETETRVARAVLEHYSREGMEDVSLEAIEYACVLGAGWDRKWWNANRGEPLLPAEEAPMEGDDGAEQRTGAMEFDAFKPNDSYFDPGLTSARKFPWNIFRKKVNRWDLAADFPEHAEAILSYKSSRVDLECRLSEHHTLSRSAYEADEDMLYRYELWHDDMPAMPGGRWGLFLGNGLLLVADALPGKRYSVQRVAPASFLDSAHGYAPAWDLLGLQDYVNLTASIQATTQRTHGVGVIAAPKGSGVTADQVANGLTLLEYTASGAPGGGMPTPLNFTNTPQEVVEGRKLAVQDMESISGINGVVRGQPEASLKSGSALALVQAQAVQFTSDFQQSIVRYLSRSGEDCLCLFQTFASEPVQIEVTGESGTLLAQYSGSDIGSVKRVRVDIGNPLARTLAGRMELGQQLMQLALNNQQPLDMGQYLRVLETGRLEPLTDLDTKKRRNIHQENEMLARAKFQAGPDGQPASQPHPITGAPQQMLDQSTLPKALATDDWTVHVKQHLSVLDSPEARANPAVRQAVFTHVTDHLKALTEAQMSQPGLLELAGVPGLNAVMGMMQAAAGAPPPGQEKQAAPGAPAGGEEGTTPEGGPPGQAEMPRQPNMPPEVAFSTGVNPQAPGPGGAEA
jgi:hypothetical protein